MSRDSHTTVCRQYYIMHVDDEEISGPYVSSKQAREFWEDQYGPQDGGKHIMFYLSTDAAMVVLEVLP